MALFGVKCIPSHGVEGMLESWPGYDGVAFPEEGAVVKGVSLSALGGLECIVVAREHCLLGKVWVVVGNC